MQTNAILCKSKLSHGGIVYFPLDLPQETHPICLQWRQIGWVSFSMHWYRILHENQNLCWHFRKKRAFLHIKRVSCVAVVPCGITLRHFEREKKENWVNYSWSDEIRKTSESASKVSHFPHSHPWVTPSFRWNLSIIIEKHCKFIEHHKMQIVAHFSPKGWVHRHPNDNHNLF